ncbi:hypothetical protein EWM64_g10560, partial [Hericium alpestre]
MQTIIDASPAQSAPTTNHQTNGQATSASVDAEHTLKRAYLTALPHAQVVALCLTIDGHLPSHVKATLWPADLQAAIASLQARLPHPTASAAQNGASFSNATPSTGQNASTEQPKATAEPPMASLTDFAPTPHAPTPQSQTIASIISSHPGTPAPQAGLSKIDPPNLPVSQTSTPAAGSASTSTAAPPLQGSYPHAPYGFGQTHQHPYPHAPYYPPLPNFQAQFPPHSSSYPYPPYPGPHPHHPYPPAPNAQPSGSPFTSAPLTRHPLTIPPDPNAMGADDLPSYEDMIVEALNDLDDPEGCAPKALFTWMASHYPLQTNFRPSASQALQKAYKKGRLEKSEAGKYRLNVNWEGGPTNRRTTRRPQTLNQTTFGQQQAPLSSPFTHAPLTHNHHQSASPAPHPPPGVPGQPPYPNYPYPFSRPPPVYPAFHPHPSQPSATSATRPAEGTSPAPPPDASAPEPAGATTSASEPSAASVSVATEDVGEGSDAWVAAQNILQAINFGTFLQGNNQGSTAPADDATGPPPEPLVISSRATAPTPAPAPAHPPPPI